MDCLFRCFRFKDDRNPHALLRAEPVLHNAREPVLYRRPFLPLQQSLEQQTEIDEHSPSKDDDGSSSSKEERELKAEAGFLKACGTLSETPAEIRKMCTKFKDMSSSCKDSEPPDFHSWLPNVSIQSPKLEQQAEHDVPMTPIQTSRLNEQIITSAAASSNGFVSNKLPRNKSVHFECQVKNHETPIPSSSSMVSPYPTPLKLTDEMETPCTAFPSTFSTSLGNNKYQRIRSQYVYPVLETNHNVHQLKSLKEESLDQEKKVMNTIEEELSHQSLSDDYQCRKICINGTPANGLIEDFKGIPNTTHKYNEDQKVKWHATPFEDRLERALSNEALVSFRTTNNDATTPVINLDEVLDERNSATSKLQSSSPVHVKTRSSRGLAGRKRMCNGAEGQSM